MEIGLLGALRVVDGDLEVTIRGAKQRALIAILALQNGSAVQAEQLIELVWGDDPPANPQNALQAQIATARRTLGAEAIETTGTSYVLHYDVAASEIATFVDRAAAGRAALDSDNPPVAASELASALSLWRGPALADFEYEPWARPEITRLEELRAATLDARIDAELSLGRGADLVGEIEALLAEDRLREHRWAQLMLALYRSGRQADALRAAAEARTTLVEELGVDPGPELVELEAKILAHDVAPVARPAGQAPSRPPLPAPLTRFFGRARELEAIRVATSDEQTRLVTLVGPGGAGKTRLAVEAARAAEEAGDAALVAFVALDTVSDASVVSSVVANAVGLRRDNPNDAPASDPLTAVAALLADRAALLVLDNCEQIVGEAARVAEALLGVCPGLTILATSREGLGVPGESLIAVGPLDASDASNLFADRARAVRKDADVEAQATAIAEICARLDGLPLALELAAARAKTLPIAQIGERLEQRFGLLTGGARNAVPRQRTLRAVVDWSYDLLSEDEQELFRRLSVFSGGWTLVAAERVCGDERLDADAVFELLSVLVDKSLVVAHTDDAVGRYSMLQTLAEYAHERMTEHGQAPVFRDRHATWFAALVESEADALTSTDTARSRAALEADADNLRAALAWLCQSGRAADALALADAVALLWWLRGDWAEGQRWSEHALAAAGDQPAGLRAINEVWAAFYAANAGADPDAALAACRSGVQRLDELGDLRLRARGHVALTTLLSRQRDPGQDNAATAAIDVAAEYGDPWFHGVAYALRALHQIRVGALEDATAAATRSVELLESVGDRAVVFEARSVLVTVAQLSGRLDDAESLVEDMSNAACHAEVRHYEQWCCTRLGVIRATRGDVETAEELHRSALAIGADPWADAHAYLGLAVCSRRCGDLAGARAHSARAHAIHEHSGAAVERGYLHLIDAWVEVEANATDVALELASAAEKLAPDAASVSAMALEIRAAVSALRGEIEDARRSLSEADRLAPVVGHAAWWLTRPDVARIAEVAGIPRS